MSNIVQFPRTAVTSTTPFVFEIQRQRVNGADWYVIMWYPTPIESGEGVRAGLVYWEGASYDEAKSVGASIEQEFGAPAKLFDRVAS